MMNNKVIDECEVCGKLDSIEHGLCLSCRERQLGYCQNCGKALTYSTAGIDDFCSECCDKLNIDDCDV